MAAIRHKPQGHGAGRGCAKSCLDIAIAPEAPRAIAFKRARKKTGGVSPRLKKENASGLPVLTRQAGPPYSAGGQEVLYKSSMLKEEIILGLFLPLPVYPLGPPLAATLSTWLPPWLASASFR